MRYRNYLLEMLFFLILTYLCVVSTAQAWKQTPAISPELCYKQLYNLQFLSADKDTLQPLCQEGYLSYFDNKHRIPKIVYYKLNRTLTLGCAPRSELFMANSYVVNSASPEDYKASIYDKGHMAPSADLSWDEIAERESYLMTNIAPQYASFNRGIWKSLEAQIRGYVFNEGGDYIIVVGAVYDEKDTLLNNKVRIPHAYYKILISLDTKRVIAWFFKHEAPSKLSSKKLTSYEVSIKQLSNLTSVTFTELQSMRTIPISKVVQIRDNQFQNQKHIFCKSSIL